MSSPQVDFAFGPSGGIGGTAFYPAIPLGAYKIIKVWGRVGSTITQIGFTWSTPNGDMSSPAFGAKGDPNFEVNIGAGDYLTQIFGSLNSQTRVSTLKFVTKNNVETTVGSQLTDDQFGFSSPPGYQIALMFGRSGSEIDALGVTIGPLS